WMQKNGIRGIKVDFFGGDKQETMRLYHDILADANDYGLLVVFHGCTLPRGWERMYPNYAASEAVLASENLHFSQGACDNEAFNATIHPFVRNAVGSMDFGGSALNKHYNAANAPKGSKRVTSDVFALATAVMFQSALQHFALAPNNIADAPDWAIDFMKAVPTTWDDTRYIDGYPGRYAVIARRHGSDWYIVGVNASSSPVTLNMSPDMIAPGERVRLYSDDKNLVGSVSEVKADKKGRIKVTMPTGGGFVIMKRSNPDFHVYLCLGQSNMEGNARYESCDTAGISPRFHMMAAVDMPGKGRLKGRWYTAQPPLARGNTGLTPADYFGRELVKSLPEKVEVGVINVAVGGCRIELFDPINCADHIKGQPDWLKSTVRNYDNNPYQRLIDMARAAQADGVIKGILLHQGESNTGDAEWPVKVKNLYERILADLDLRAEDVPLLAGEMLSAEKGGKCASMSKIINTLPEVIPTAHVVSADGCDGAPDGLHFTAEGYRLLGKRYAQAMLPLLKK
ncbi:glycoside hydrolase family 97 catalytic domain-containing protein, partial [uncultured Duncaniella sp.]